MCIRRLQEKHVLEMQCKHQRNILELQEKLKHNLQQVCGLIYKTSSDSSKMVMKSLQFCHIFVISLRVTMS